jgi:hypothetical protein
MSEVKVNKISPRTNCGTVQLGDSGDTITIPAGATITNSGTQTGFGRTGTVNWETTVKTSGFTAANGEGYFVNTTAGEITVNLPAGAAGSIVAFKDYANTWDTNKVTLTPNGSDKISGTNANSTLTTESQSVTLIFVDSTKGWLDIHDSTADVQGAQFITACGGNTTITCGNFKTHVFTSPGTFTVSAVGNAAGSDSVDYVVVAGGGGANKCYAAGGGAGGFRLANGLSIPAPTMSPLANSSSLPVTATGFPITIGAGGGAPPTGSARACSGNPSTFSSITSTAGGGGGAGGTPAPASDAPGLPGGSGGGGGGYGPSPGGRAGGTGNTPPVDPPQGQPGGTAIVPAGGSGYTSAGGGGAGGAAPNVTSPGPTASDISPGGIGSFVSDTFFGPTAPSYGTPGPVSNTRYFAGGGGGGWYNSGPLPDSTPAPGGAGGGGQGTSEGSNPLPAASQNGTVNTGGGAGGGGNSAGGYGGGSGVVFIRYKFQ